MDAVLKRVLTQEYGSKGLLENKDNFIYLFANLINLQCYVMMSYLHEVFLPFIEGSVNSSRLRCSRLAYNQNKIGHQRSD